MDVLSPTKPPSPTRPTFTRAPTTQKTQSQRATLPTFVPTSVPTPINPVLRCLPGSKIPACAVSTVKPSVVPEWEALKVPICLQGSKDPECIVSNGSDDFPVTEQTAEPSSTEKTTTSKAVVEGWKGDPQFHAFHTFHFQRGDGRRGRFLPGRKVKRNSDSDTLNEITQVRLTRSVQILPAVGVDPSLDFVDYNDSGKPEGKKDSLVNTICISLSSLSASVAFTIISLVALIAAIIVLNRKYNRAEELLSKHISVNCDKEGNIP